MTAELPPEKIERGGSLKGDKGSCALPSTNRCRMERFSKNHGVPLRFLNFVGVLYGLVRIFGLPTGVLLYAAAGWLYLGEMKRSR